MQEKTKKIRSATSEIQRKSEVPLPIFSENPKCNFLVSFHIVHLKNVDLITY